MAAIRLKDPESFRKMLILKGHSLRSFAKHIGISSPYITQIAKGDRNPGPRIAKMIAEGLECEFDEIFFVKDACKSYQNKTA